MVSGLMQEALHALYACGREAWPAVDLDLDTFSERAARHLRDGPFDDVRATDLYLAIACAVGIDPAILVFDRHFLSRLEPALIRRGHAPTAAAEVVQAVRVRFLVGDTGVAPKIAEYNGRGSLAAWLHVTSFRLAISADRRRRKETSVDELALVLGSAGPELELLRLQFRRELESAFRTTFEAIGPQQRNLLRYQVIDRLGIDRIAALYGVHRATAARWIAHARDALFGGVRRAMQDRLHLSVAELESLFRQVRSELEISLRWLLTPAPEPPRTPILPSVPHGS
jgi:RNA polymerase sigma-70 factor (ECF subfamily)